LTDSEGIYRKANQLVRTHGTRDPVQIARARGIDVIPVGDFHDLLGMYIYRWKHRAIFLNDRMDDCLTRMVCAHELGHDIYHRDLARGQGIREFELFRMQNSTEYEANVFAAHLLLDTEECLEYVRDGYDVVGIAKMMNSEINLMLIKLQELIRLGYDLRLPIEPRGDFFREIRADGEK
jgi:Zn-dependent peptidase ImmA (M78 family)